MQRSKQQALMFLLGAVLVGGALGFSADRYIGHEKFAVVSTDRARKFYDEIGLSPSSSAPRSTRSRSSRIARSARVLAPQKPQLDSIRARVPGAASIRCSRKSSWRSSTHASKEMQSPARRRAGQGAKENMFSKLIAAARRAGRRWARSRSSTMPDTTLQPDLSRRSASPRERQQRLEHHRRQRVRTANNSVRSRAGAAVSEPQRDAPARASQLGDRLGPRTTLIPIASTWGYNTGLTLEHDAVRRRQDVRRRPHAARPTSRPREANEVNTRVQRRASGEAGIQRRPRRERKRGRGAARSSRRRSFSSQTSIAKVNAGAANVSDSLRQRRAGRQRAARDSHRAEHVSAPQSATLTRLVGTPYLVTAQLADTVEHCARADRQRAGHGAGARRPDDPPAQAQLTAANGRAALGEVGVPADGQRASFSSAAAARARSTASDRQSVSVQQRRSASA